MSAIASSVRIWAEMVKLPHSVFALPFALIAAFLAGQKIDGRTWPYPGQLALVLVCMVGARSVAMTFNRIADARIDARNPRTAGRPLPAGALSLQTAWVMLLVAAMMFLLGCVGFHVFYGNSWPIVLAAPVMGYLCLYSFAKRFTRWSHFMLGSAIALSPPAAWLAIHPESLGLSAVVLAITVTCWIAGFDIIYACQDIEVDRRDGLFSLPARLGPAAALWIGRASHVVTVGGLVALGFLERLGMLYATGVALAAVLLAVENALVKPGDYRRVTMAFFTINGVVSILLAVAAIADLHISAARG